MQHLDQKIKDYLVSIGCTFPDGEAYLCDILRKDNAEKIWGEDEGDVSVIWEERTWSVLNVFQDYPDTWPEEVAKLIKP